MTRGRRPRPKNMRSIGLEDEGRQEPLPSITMVVGWNEYAECSQTETTKMAGRRRAVCKSGENRTAMSLGHLLNRIITWGLPCRNDSTNEGLSLLLVSHQRVQSGGGYLNTRGADYPADLREGSA